MRWAKTGYRGSLEPRIHKPYIMSDIKNTGTANPPPKQQKSFTDRMTGKYLFALGVIAILVITTYIELTLRIRGEGDSSEYIVNTSGRQRMLSQRIAMFCLRLEDLLKGNAGTDAIKEIRGKILETANLMEESHFILTNEEMSPEVNKLYFEPPTNIDQQVSSYIGLAKTMAMEAELGYSHNRHQVENLIRHQVEELINTQDLLLHSLDMVVTQYQKEGETSINAFQARMTLMFSLILAALIMVWFFIFRPMARYIQAEARALADSSDKLKIALTVSEDLRLAEKEAKEMAELYAREAEQANHAKTEFLANMSHELRTPLNGILGIAELMLAANPTDEQRKLMDMVQSSGINLLALINDLLDISKIEAGQLKLELTKFRLRDMVESVVEQYAVLAHDKGLELLMMIDKDTPDILTGDPGKLRQVIINILGNAIKFTKEGEVILNVGLESLKGGVAIILFHVQDTGPGIPPAYQEKIFGRFIQADGGSTRQHGGTGLGTAISKQIVEMMGGKIWLESEEGKGSSFYFTVAIETQASPPNQRDETCKRAGSIKVLIADDNPTSLEIIKKLAIEWGATAVTVDTGDKAFDKLIGAVKENCPFDILFLDHSLVSETGVSMLDKILSEEQLKSLKIIFLAPMGGGVEPSNVNQVKIAKLVKPIKRSDFMKTASETMGFIERRESLIETDPDGPIQSAKLDILLAEDNIINQKVATMALEKLGHHITVAGNGKIAVEKFDNGGFDLILMDIQMPEMDGYEAVKEIRQREEVNGGHIPIIAMTAHAMSGDRAKCISAGMDEYISKPIRLGELGKKIDKVIHKTAPPKPIEEKVEEDGKGFDMGDIYLLLNNDESAVTEFLDVFVSDVEKNISLLAGAIDSGDAKAVQSVAHEIKGSVSQIGALGLVRLAQELEVMGSKNDLAMDASRKIADLIKKFDKIKVKLKEKSWAKNVS